MGLEMVLKAQVHPGSVSTNFAEFKELVRKELEENYKTIVVSEEHLKNAKDARATLNKAKESLKQTMRSAQLENDEPLKIAKQQAKELEALLDDAINTLDVQIKEIEGKRRQERKDRVVAILATKVDNLPDELIDFATGCMGWMVNPKWENSSYSFASIMADCDEAVQKLQQAWELLQGDYRPQMLAEFQRTGDLAKAQLLGLQLAKEAKAFTPPPIPETAKTIPNQENKTSYVDQIVIIPEAETKTVAVDVPKAFWKDEKSDKNCRADFRIRGKRYELEWFMAVCERFNISLERLDK